MNPWCIPNIWFYLHALKKKLSNSLFTFNSDDRWTPTGLHQRSPLMWERQILTFWDKFWHFCPIWGGPSAFLSFSFCIYLDSFRTCFASGVQIDYWIGTYYAEKLTEEDKQTIYTVHPFLGIIKYQAARSAEKASNCKSGGKILEL